MADSPALETLSQQLGEIMIDSPTHMCPICLSPDVCDLDTVILKECRHKFCVACITKWIQQSKDKYWCPLCKQSFQGILVHRMLDGSILDHFEEESLSLFIRARWVQLQIQHQQQDENEQQGYNYEEDDYELSSYVTSAHLISNRKFGESGFMKNERLVARPNVSVAGKKKTVAAVQKVISKKKKKKNGKPMS